MRHAVDLHELLRVLLRLNFSLQILLGLFLGVLVGLFFGEPAAALQPLADAYVRLLQVSVLPYLVLVLIVGFGQLDGSWAKRLGLRAAAMLGLVWLATIGVIVAMTLAFPELQTASFFSQTMTEPRRSLSLVDLYFTPNVFQSLVNDAVPPVALFSSMVGLCLIGLPGRERVLEVLRTLTIAIERINGFVIRLTPIGVFAIGAVTAGTMLPETFHRLEVYAVTFVAASLLLTFWILPLAISAVTPIRARDVIATSRDALLTAFLVSSAFVVLPVIVDRSRALLRARGLLDEKTESAADVLVPILFNFPNAGRLLTLLFVPFAAWLAGQAMGGLDLLRLFAIGIPTYFAKAQVALPFLFDLFGIPHDLFALYLPTSILAGRFDSMVTVMNLLAFSLIGAAAMGSGLAIRRARVVRALVLGVAGTVVVALAVHLLLAATVDTVDRKGEALRRMHALRASGPAIVHVQRANVPADSLAHLPVARRVRERGTLRVGYDPGNLPFSFFNTEHELVGFDVEIASLLAQSLGVVPEFVPVRWTEVATLLAVGTIDVMPGIWYRPFWFDDVRLSEPYTMGTMGFVVRDARRHEFEDVRALRRSSGLRIGVPIDATQVQYSIARYFGDADVTFVPIEPINPFLGIVQEGIDAYLMPAENGASWTLLHPEFTVVVPQPDPVRIPIAFGVSLGAGDFVRDVDQWVHFADSEGTLREAYAHWVLGGGAQQRGPRWSIARDVLGWGQ